MANSSGDPWIREYNEAAKLAEDVSGMISETAAAPLSSSRSDSQRHFSAVRRKITILGTRLDSLEALLAKLPSQQPISGKELKRRKDMMSNLRSKTNQMAATLNMSNFGNRDSLLGPEIKSVDAVTRASGLDNQGIVSLQRQVMKEQDEGLDKLEETVHSTKHVALAVNEELDLHTRLIDTLDYQVELTGSGLQKVARGLAVLNKKTRESCSCLCLMLTLAGVIILILVIIVLIKYL